MVDKLAEIVQKAPPEFAVTAAVSLGEMGRKEAVSALIRALDNPSPVVQEAAAYALGKIGDPGGGGPAHRPSTPSQRGCPAGFTRKRSIALPGNPNAGVPRRTTLRGASLYFLGGGRGDTLREQWRSLIDEYDLRVDGTGSGRYQPGDGALRRPAGYPRVL